MGESSFWYRPTRVVPDQRPLNGRCCCCQWWGAGMAVCLERSADLHVIQLMSMHPKTPSSLASFKSRLVLPFWHRLTQVVLEKRSLNGCRSSNHKSMGGPVPDYCQSPVAIICPSPLTYVRQRPITASHSSRDMIAIISPAINTAHFYFFCCRSYVKLLDY